MSVRKIGLQKSLTSMFGEERIRKDFMNKIEESKKKEELEKNKSLQTNKEDKKEESLVKEDKNANIKIEGTMVKINLVQPNLNQPRKNFEDEKIEELSESIKKYGILQPIIVRQEGALYKIIAGERRWRAAKKAGLTSVPVQIKEYDDRTAKEVAIIENVQREDLNAVEEALAYQNLISEYGLTQEEVAKRVSKSRSAIANSMRILKLQPEVLEYIKQGKLSEGHARALLSIEDELVRNKIAKRAIEENLSVRDIEKLVRLEKLIESKKEKKFKNANEEKSQLGVIIKNMEKNFKQKLNTKVKIIPKTDETGKVEIEYYSMEDLDRIFLLFGTKK